MPSVVVNQERFFQLLGSPEMSIEEFDQICFDFGVELDEVTNERAEPLSCSKSKSDKTLLKIDVSANRYDLLCEEGLSRALRIFLGREGPPFYRTVRPRAHLVIVVKKETSLIRPFIVAAVLHNVSLTKESYDSFIDFQEKLHLGLCRRRTKVAIGTHDLDVIAGPLTYEALNPKDIVFAPLNEKDVMNGHQIMKFYEQDRRLSKYLPIIRDSPIYPVVLDSKKRVLSLPPIINSDYSKISVNTKNIFIECTATDEAKAQTALNMIVGIFSQYCSDKFTVEQVEVKYEDVDKSRFYPDLSRRTVETSLEYVNACVGRDIRLSASDVEEYLKKMGLVSIGTTEVDNCTIIKTEVPPTRSDVLHPCDIMEDVAVAYGINRIPKTIPTTNSVGTPLPINKLSDLVRREMAMCGWSEVLSLTLSSHDENFAFLRRQDNGHEAVVLANPKSSEYEVVRSTLISGLLKTAASNRKSALPLRIFEIGDIVVQNDNSAQKAINRRRLAILYSNHDSGFEIVHGILDHIMKMLEMKRGLCGYTVVPSFHDTFFPDRQADVLCKNVVVGTFGIIHPLCLGSFDLQYPCSCLELDLEYFL